MAGDGHAGRFQRPARHGVLSGAAEPARGSAALSGGSWRTAPPVAAPRPPRAGRSGVPSTRPTACATAWRARAAASWPTVVSDTVEQGRDRAVVVADHRDVAPGPPYPGGAQRVQQPGGALVVEGEDGVGQPRAQQFRRRGLPGRAVRTAREELGVAAPAALHRPRGTRPGARPPRAPGPRARGRCGGARARPGAPRPAGPRPRRRCGRPRRRRRAARGRGRRPGSRAASSLQRGPSRRRGRAAAAPRPAGRAGPARPRPRAGRARGGSSTSRQPLPATVRVERLDAARRGRGRAGRGRPRASGCGRSRAGGPARRGGSRVRRRRAGRVRGWPGSPRGPRGRRWTPARGRPRPGRRRPPWSPVAPVLPSPRHPTGPERLTPAPSPRSP